MNPSDIVKFLGLRTRLFSAIEKQFEESEDGHCKSYEGAMAIHFPNYFEDRGEGRMGSDSWGVTLDLYVIGPSRHYGWWAPTLSEAIDKATAEISEWIRHYEEVPA